MTAERTSPWRYLGFTIWPVLDDETETVDYYDIMGPCADEEHRVRDARCDCPIVLEPEEMAGSVREARAIVRRVAADRRWHRRALGIDPHT